MYPIKFRLSDNHFSEIEINDFFFSFFIFNAQKCNNICEFWLQDNFFFVDKNPLCRPQMSKKKVKQRYGQKRYRFFGQINMSFDINYCSDEL
jgi:hypothetical protein